MPTLAAGPQTASEVVQPRPRDYGCTDLLPPVGECLESLGIDTPDAGSPPADMDISVVPDVPQTAVSVTTEMSERWIEIDTPDPVKSGMKVAGGSPPADIDISVGPDVLPTAVSVTTEVSELWIEINTSDPVESGMEVAGGSPPAVLDISVGPAVLQTAVSVTAIVSEEWMERFVINLDILCLDGLASTEDPAGGSSDVGSGICVVPDPLPTAVSVWSVVAELFPGRMRWPGRSGRPCLRSIPLLFLLGGGEVADAYPLVVVVRYSVSVWPTVG